MKRIISAITVLAITLLFVGCYMQTAVTFNMDFIVDGEVYATVKTDRSSIEMPDDPVKDDYKFDGWFWDKDVWEKPLTLNSLIDAPLSQTLQVYAKFKLIEASPIDPVTIGKFYHLQEAYEYEWLTQEDLGYIAFLYNNRYNPIEPQPEKPPLSNETENKIKQTYLESFFPEFLIDFSGYEYDIENPINGIRITAYYGTYNDCVVVSVWDDFVCYDWPQTVDVTIGGAVFESFWIREIFVFVEEEIFTITATAGEGGCISPSGIIEVAKDGSATFSVYSYATNDSHGIKAVYVDGERVSVILLDMVGYIWKYTFKKVNANHTIHAEFIPVKAQSVPFSVGQIVNKPGSLSYNSTTRIITYADVGCLVQKPIPDGFEFWLDYDEAFFAEKALVVYIFNASTTGGTLDVVELVKQDGKLIMDINFQAGYADALSYWTVVLEVNKADIVGIDEVEISLSKKDRPVHPFDSMELEALLLQWENVAPNDRPDRAWAVLKAAVDAANMILDKGPISQNQIDWITNVLKKSIDDLTSPWAIHGFAANPILCVVEDSFRNITFTKDNFPEIDVEFIETLSSSIIFIHLKTQNHAYTLYAISLLQERQELSAAEVNSIGCLGQPFCNTCVAVGIWRSKQN